MERSSRPPAPPPAPTAVAGNTQATITVAAGSGGAPASYVVNASSGGGNCTVTGASGSCTITGLSNGTAYTFTTTATNDSGTSSASLPSAPVTPFTLPDAPPAPGAVAGDQEVVLTWSAPAANGSPITDYAVQYRAAADPAWSTASRLASTATSETVSGLSNGTAYEFRVAAINAAGTGGFSPASAAVVPAAPIAATSDPAGLAGPPSTPAADRSRRPPAGPRPLRVSVVPVTDPGASPGPLLITGRVPRRATRVVLGATQVGESTASRRTRSAMARTQAMRCPITRSEQVRTFRCAPRLPAGRWRLTTRAIAGSVVIAQQLQVVRVTARMAGRGVGAGAAVTG